MIEFHCPHCDALLKTSDEKAGRSARCPTCRDLIEVPRRKGEELVEELDSELLEIDDEQPLIICPMCGETVTATEPECPACGEFLDSYFEFTSGDADALRPHHGSLVILLSVLSWVMCPVCGILAWVTATQDLKEMATGRMDPSGETMTRIGRGVAIVQMIVLVTIFSALLIHLLSAD